MKNLILMLAFMVVGFTATAQSWTTQRLGENCYIATITDTITDTEVDTLAIPGTLASAWVATYGITGDELSGTIDFAYVVEENLNTSGGTWQSVDTDVSTTDGEEIILTDAAVAGLKQRIRITGTGTQSSVYSVRIVYKK